MLTRPPDQWPPLDVLPTARDLAGNGKERYGQREKDTDLQRQIIESCFVPKDLLIPIQGPGDLVRFHTAHKLTVLAHSPDHYQKMGRLVGTPM